MNQSAETIAFASVVVAASQTDAFATFVNLDAWWPRESHHIGSLPAVASVLESHTGGRIFERSEDGTECDWGRVLAYEPPSRLLLDWQLTFAFEYDPRFHSNVEVLFIIEGPKQTRVELRHDVEPFGEKAAEMRATFESGGGWTVLLARFAAIV